MLMPRPKQPEHARTSLRRLPPGVRQVGTVVVCALIVSAGLFTLPNLIALDLRIEGQQRDIKDIAVFPVTVNPATKTIEQDPEVERLLGSQDTRLTAAAGNASIALSWLASLVTGLPAYQSLAATSLHIVTIPPGFRQEQVASAFGSALNWSSAQRAQFIKQLGTGDTVLTEGELQPGTYMVYGGQSASDVKYLLTQRFNDEIVSRYSTTTQEQVPLSEALTIASLLEREAGGWDDMRKISGVIWNRLFLNMNLQIDATLQYAKASNPKTNLGMWWAKPIPADKYIKSPYNTYQHPGLPPGPIATPSVAAVLAALNPEKTECLFYFHDSRGNFHCSPTYAGHVALLKQYYGQGK